MGFLIGLLTVVMVLDCLLLIFLVLIQLPKKEAGAGLAFGGGRDRRPVRRRFRQRPDQDHQIRRHHLLRSGGGAVADAKRLPSADHERVRGKAPAVKRGPGYSGDGDPAGYPDDHPPTPGHETGRSPRQ